jgi:exonuclease SbcC
VILLESIRIRNFRAISEVTFQPLQDGITGIIGQNGAGKSTLLYATVWALYGVRPPDTNVANLRREGSTGECSVSVVFRHLGQSVEVIRELRTSGKTNNTIVAIYVDGIPQTNAASVSSADAWIQSRLGVDSNGFMTAFVVMQKELDELVKARPAERKALIERLAGIDKINGALRLARDVENEGKRVLGNSSGSQEAVEEAENRMNVLSDELEQRGANRQKLAERVRGLEQNLRSTQAELRQIQQVQVTHAGASAGLEGIKREIEQLDERIASLSYLQDMDSAGVGDVAELRAQHAELRGQLKELQDRISQQKSRLGQNEYTTAQEQQRRDQADAYIKSMTEQIRNREAIELEEGQRRQSIADGTSRRYLLADRADSSDQAADALAKHAHAGGDAECPTCHQHLEDPSALISSLRLTAEESRAEAEHLRVEVAGHQARLAELERMVADLKQVDTAAEQLRSSTEVMKTLLADHEVIVSAIAADDEAIHTQPD